MEIQVEKKVLLTGIKPTGIPHLGNYFGAIKPALTMVSDDSYDARLFIADYHSINTIRDPKILKQYVYEVAATWLSCGLDPEKVLLYRQSSVPETLELNTILNAFTAKGLMNRAHAYKAAVDKNREKDKPEDHGINMGLYTYPILMAADILLFDANVVPVGKDQVQHVEMACDIAQAINHNYKSELLTIPSYVIDENTKTIVGMDGRKMSKSYGNAIELFLPEKKLKKTINKIVTNSQEIEEVKDPETCNVFALYKLFATKEQQDKLAKTYRAGGMGWGHAKGELFEVVNAELKPIRDKYYDLMDNKDYIDEVLKKGEAKAREIAAQKILKLRKAIGID
ncbi:tryptophan--tRNA ligase [Thiospirochaeta perfilievii]|uniref:Tryptophan--tRNA ligase n=2 Tax=Thiospirochaeta perfilievii TaxID=252967 RepID=A0A5C1QE70_9SPIO|nr:tryptophan--tRNA ligase [Thiospirochaeta perfilievii]